MYTQIPFTKIIDSLPVTDQKNINRKEFENSLVYLEDIWDNLSEFEKKEFLKENAKKIFDEFINYGCIPIDDIENYISRNPGRVEDILDEIDEDDIIDYLESLGYVVDEYIH